MPARSENTVPRRRGRPAREGRGTPRSDIVEHALGLMRKEPWLRVSAKRVAEAAGCDPALITYYFGGRNGLMLAVAEEVALRLRPQLTLGYADANDSAAGLQMAVNDPVRVLGGAPLLGQLYVDELLLQANEYAGAVLGDIAAGYFDDLNAVVARASAEASLRHVQPKVVVSAVASVALMYFFFAPAFARGLDGPHVSADPQAFASALGDVVIRGALSGNGVRQGVSGARASKGKPNIRLNEVTRGRLVEAAVDMMRNDGLEKVSLAQLAQRTGYKTAAIKAYFPTSATLMTAVAAAAVQALNSPPARSGQRGRPQTHNPAIARRLVEAAVDIATEQGSLSVRSVAIQASCDPALVTYYFGDRRGLVLAAAKSVLDNLVSRFDVAYEPDLPVAQRLPKALVPSVRAIADRPGLSRHLLDEMLIRGDAKSDRVLGDVLEPYFEKIRETIDEGVADGVFRIDDRDVLQYALGVLPVFLGAAIPITHRAFFGTAMPGTSSALADAIVHLVLHGLLRSDEDDV